MIKENFYCHNYTQNVQIVSWTNEYKYICPLLTGNKTENKY